MITHTKYLSGGSIGMTGNRDGFKSRRQQLMAWSLMKYFLPETFHHGACVGMDDEMHRIALAMNILIVCHRPIDESLMAACTGAFQDREPKTYFARNRNIVNETDLLLSFPRNEWNPNDKGGTVYTTNFALKLNKPTIIVTPTKDHWYNFPDGTEKHFLLAQVLRHEKGSTQG